MNTRRTSTHQMALDPSRRGNDASLSDEEAMATYYNMERDYTERDEELTNGTYRHDLRNSQKGYPKPGSSQNAYKYQLVANDDATGSRWDDLSNRIREKAKKSFTKKVMYKRLPFLSWMPKYNADDAVGDLVAGITVGLTVIPQGLAYGNLAGLPTQVCIPSLVVCIKTECTTDYYIYVYLKKGTGF